MVLEQFEHGVVGNLLFHPPVWYVYAFFDYVPGRELGWERFVGLKHFTAFFQGRDAGIIIRNTLVIGGLNTTVGFAAPIVLALLFDELRSSKLKRVAQTISYLPFFVSWVVVASTLTAILSSEGVLNEALVSLGILENPSSSCKKESTSGV